VEFRRHVDEIGERVRLHLAHTRPRWALTVISLNAEVEPDCLFKRPVTTSAMTSCSRRLSEA